MIFLIFCLAIWFCFVLPLWRIADNTGPACGYTREDIERQDRRRSRVIGIVSAVLATAFVIAMIVDSLPKKPLPMPPPGVVADPNCRGYDQGVCIPADPHCVVYHDGECIPYCDVVRSGERTCTSRPPTYAATRTRRTTPLQGK